MPIAPTSAGLRAQPGDHGAAAVAVCLWPILAVDCFPRHQALMGDRIKKSACCIPLCLLHRLVNVQHGAAGIDVEHNPLVRCQRQ